MKLNFGWTLIGLLLLGAVACDDDDDQSASTITMNDQTFLSNAAFANLAEIAAASAAKDRASNQDVVAFANHMVEEHNTAWTDLQNLANSKKTDLPDSADQGHRAKLAYLKTLQGYQFDTAYVNSQVKDHQMAISLFTTAQMSADDADVRAYAVKYLPHLQEHLTRAQELKAALTDGP
jgi:putative membrane protein